MNFMGQAGFVWWFGVVEDTDDPLKLGRVRVRIFGFHTRDKKLLPTADLPWAHPLQDIASASISGVGRSPTGLVAGSHVFGFFRDGSNAQQPIVMFSVGGIPSEIADKKDGFNDPDGIYPTQEYVDAKHSDLNFLATGEKTDKTIIETRKNGLKKDVRVAFDQNDEQKWSEPESPYKPKYPKNKVFATESGMVEEWDDTPEKQRHHTYHPSGSFEEVANGWKDDPNGTRVQKIVGNNYEIIGGTDFVHVSGDVNLTVDGNTRLFIGAGQTPGNLLIQVEGGAAINVKQDVRVLVDGNYTLDVKGDYRETIGGNRYTTSGGNVLTENEGSFVVSSKGNAVLKTKSGSDLNVSGSSRLIQLNSRGAGGDPTIPPPSP
jgi:hypothetical protein